MSSRYNGWENYETWLTNLWLCNEQGAYTYWREVARDVWQAAEQNHFFSRREVALNVLAERLRDEITENAPRLGDGLYDDLLKAALSEINWHEVAADFLEEIADPDEEATGKD